MPEDLQTGQGQAEQAAQDAQLEGEYGQLEARMINLVANQEEVFREFLDQQYEQWMELKHGRKKSLFGAGKLFHYVRRFCAGDYEAGVPLSQSLGTHKSKAKIAFGLGAGALGMGVLGGTIANPALAAIGGAYLARGLVESGKKWRRGRMTEGLKEGKRERIGLDRQIELAYVAKLEYARQLASELQGLKETREGSPVAYHAALEKMVDFIYQAETNDFSVKYYKVDGGYKAMWAEEGRGARQAEEVAEVKMSVLLKKSLRNDRIAGLMESAAGILGGSVAGYLALVQAKLQVVERVTSGIGDAQTQLRETVSRVGARGIKFDKKAGQWLMDIAQDKPLPGISPEQFTDYHQIIKDSDGTIKFLRSAAEQKYLQGHPELLESISRPDALTHGLITDPAQLEIAQKTLEALDWHSQLVNSLQAGLSDSYAGAIRQATVGLAAVTGQPALGSAGLALDRAARAEYTKMTAQKAAERAFSKEAIEHQRQATAEMPPISPTEQEAAVSIPSGIIREQFDSGKIWQRKPGVAVREEYSWTQAGQLSIFRTGFALDGDKIRRISLKIVGQEQLILLEKDKEIKAFLDDYEPAAPESA